MMRLNNSGKFVRSALEAVLTRVLSVVQSEDSTTEFGSLMGKMQGIVWDLSHAKSTVDCVWDPTLHLGALGKGENGGTGDFAPFQSSC